MPRPELSYPKTAVNKVNRYNQLAHYDTTTVHTIVSTCRVVHVSFIVPGDPPTPTTLPMIGIIGSFARPSASLADAQDYYLHGYISARLFRENRIRVCVAATHVDGIVLSLTPFTHSINYRSAVLHGEAELVTDAEEKMFVMERITESVMPGRWAESRTPPDNGELASTGILRMKIESASAKINEGGAANDEKKDLKRDDVTGKVWTGVVPMWTQYGEPIRSGGGRVDAVPQSIVTELKARNEHGKHHAEKSSVDKSS